ncbi:Ku protein [Peterkaempfera sp. SMS 1(5)a]|uniref:Ku protein n=1 Tax=Peterkaempfera podocarpi TaxID=3232308 RepID=UPI0036700EBD
MADRDSRAHRLLNGPPGPAPRLVSRASNCKSTEVRPIPEVRPTSRVQVQYLGADGAAAGRPYVLLRDALVESGQVAICRVAVRSRESLAVLHVRDDVLVLHTLLWPDEIRPTAGIAPVAPELRRQELQMARSLMQVISEDFRLEEQRDEYRHALEQVVEAKLAGVEPPHAPGARVLPAGVVDLMAALQATVDEARAHRHGDEAPSASPQGKTQRKHKGEATGAQKKAAAKKPARRHSAG